MRAHWAYFKKIMLHKKYVMIACWHLRVPMLRALVHDWTKFTPREWGPYVRRFFYPSGNPKTVTHDTSEFELAWLHHQRQPHHWEAWCIVRHNGNTEALEMPETYAREMVADWVAAGWAHEGRRDPRPWYEKNGNNIVLHPRTRKLVELLLIEASVKIGENPALDTKSR